MEQTTERRWHEVWREQCEAAESIRVQHGDRVGLRLCGRREAAHLRAGGGGAPRVRAGIAAIRLGAQTHVHARGNRGAPGADRERAS